MLLNGALAYGLLGQEKNIASTLSKQQVELRNLSAKVDALGETGSGECSPQLVGAILRSIHATVHEELAALGDGEHAASTATDATQTPAAPEPTRQVREPARAPEQASAFARASAIVDSAIAAKEWGNDQQRDFHMSMAGLSTDDISSLIRKLVQAINAQALHVSTDGPPL
jgi:hypothetical protein